jgi:hypothetical protein
MVATAGVCVIRGFAKQKNWTGAPRSLQRTWAEKDGRSPPIGSATTTNKSIEGWGKHSKYSIFGPRTLERTRGTRPVLLLSESCQDTTPTPRPVRRRFGLRLVRVKSHCYSSWKRAQGLLQLQSNVVGKSGRAACSNMCSIWYGVMRAADSEGKLCRGKNPTSKVSKLGLASPPSSSHRNKSL